MENKVLKGHCALIGANVIWGLYAPIGKALMNYGVVSVWALSGVKIIGAALLLWLISLFLPESMQARQKVERRDLLQLFLASLLVIAGNQVLILLGLNYADPTHAAVISSMTPIYVIILAFIIFRQTVSLMKWVGVIAGVIGVLLFTFTGQTDASIGVTHPVLGDTLCVAAQICGALYLILFSKVITKYSAITLMKWMFLFSAIVILPFTVSDMVSVEWGNLPTIGWAELVFVVVFATGLAYLLLPIGQVVVKPTMVAMYNYLQPLTAAVFSLLIGLSGFTLQTTIATVLILIGVYIVSKPTD